MRGLWGLRPGPVSAAALLGTALLLGGCGLFDDEERLEGERIPVRPQTPDAAAAPLQGFGADTPSTGGAALPPPQPIEDWPQTNAGPTHNAGHLAGPASLNRAWTADAGAGDSSDGRITSPPVVVDGVVYALDSEAQLSAFGASGGAPRWSVSLAPEGEDGREGFGGGIAVDGGRIFATTGFGETMALDAGSGEILWRQNMGAPFRAAPAVSGGVVVSVTRDNRAFGFDAAAGELLWRVAGASTEAGLLGGASPAITGNVALVPFSSGEVVAIEARTGRRAWTAVLGGGRRGLARSSISDVTGDPVVAGQLVLAANQSGRIAAIEGRTGRRVWTRSIGSAAPLWVAGDSVFFVSDASDLMRLSVSTGATIWSTPLPAFEDPEDSEDPINYSGPVLVEGRVLVTSSLGEILAFDGVQGREVARTELGSGSVTGPVVAGGTLFVLTDEGTLEAFR